MMTTSNAHNFKLNGCLALAISAFGGALLGPAAECRAFDTAMICAWKRTFYTQNYLDSPLREYNMPRRAYCDCWGGTAPGWSPVWQAPAELEPARFERLGRIPNELELGALGGGGVPSR
jgi:hypothetical protein